MTATAAATAPGSALESPYSADRIKRAISAAKDGGGPIVLLVKRGERYLEAPIRYTGGLRYPWLEKDGEAEVGLDRLLAAQVP